MFDCLETILELIRLLRRLIADLARLDRDLARQIRRAANGMLLNTSEARQRAGGDRLHLYRSALGSACEVSDALRAAVAWDFVRGRTSCRSRRGSIASARCCGASPTRGDSRIGRRPARRRPALGPSTSPHA